MMADHEKAGASRVNARFFARSGPIVPENGCIPRLSSRCAKAAGRRTRRLPR